MKKSKFTEEQIADALRQVEKMHGRGRAGGAKTDGRFGVSRFRIRMHRYHP